MLKEIKSKNAPKPIGPYIQGIQMKNMVIVSGQIPINPVTKIMEEDIFLQTMQCLKNIKFIIEEATLKVNNIVKTTVFLKNFNDFSNFNKAYEKFFLMNKSSFPTRSCIGVNELPCNAKIEIEAIAFYKI